jgi:hypothetical protein
MFKFLKRIFVLALLVCIGIAIWGAFALWTGIYSVYTYPPSKEHPDGETLIVDRDQGEPTFNSPDHKEPPKKAEPESGGLKFAPMKKPARPLAERTIVKLPYIEWAYEQSVKPETPEKGEE